MPVTNSKITQIVFGLAAAASVGIILWYWLSSTKPSIKPVIKPPKKLEPEIEEEEDEDDDEEEEDEEDEEDEEEVTVVASEKKSVDVTSTPANTSEDNSAQAAAELKAANKQKAKEKYDEAVRKSSALINANKYEEAVEQLSIAISLVEEVPSASGNLLTLYNNRSAMYEKLKEYEKSISDINVVLALKPDHLKATIRRARVYEATGKYCEAIEDNIFATFLERAQNIEPTLEPKIQQLSKIAGCERSVKVLQELRNGKDRGLPSKSYCRNFFDACPNTYTWKSTYEGRSRADLLKKFEEARKPTTLVSPEALRTAFELGLELCRIDVVNENYESCFAMLKECETLLTTTSHVLESKSLLTLYHEFRGTEMHLKGDINNARVEYKKAVELYPENLTAQLKNVTILLDLGELEQCNEVYNTLIAQWKDQPVSETAAVDLNTSRETADDDYSDARSSPPPSGEDLDSPEERTACRAWILFHRSSLWLSRDSKGNYESGCLEKTMHDLEQAISLTNEFVTHSPLARGANFMSHMKGVQIITHVKPMMDLKITDEDKERNRASVQAAKLLFPDVDGIAYLEAEQLSQEEDLDGALLILEKVKRKQLVKRRAIAEQDAAFVITKASILTMKAFFEMSKSTQEGMMNFQSIVADIKQLYEDVLVVEPNAVDVLAQCAQMKSLFFGEWQEAKRLLNIAVPLARSREEIQDLCNLLVMAEANLAVFTKIQAASTEMQR